MMEIKDPENEWKRRLAGSGSHGRRALDVIAALEKRIEELEAENKRLEEQLDNCEFWIKKAEDLR